MKKGRGSTKTRPIIIFHYHLWYYCKWHVCYQDAPTAPEVHRLLHHRPLSRCPRILETRFLDLREVGKLKNCISRRYCHPWFKFTELNIFWINVSKNAISFFDHFSVVKWYWQVQQNDFPNLLCKFSPDVLVYLPNHLRCCCGWPCLSQIDFSSQRFCDK